MGEAEPRSTGLVVTRGVAALLVALVAAAVVIAVLTTLLLTRKSDTTKLRTTNDTEAAPSPTMVGALPSSAVATVGVENAVTPTLAPSPTATVEPVPTAGATALAPPTVIPTAVPVQVSPPSTPTAATRYASVEGRPYYDAYVVAANTLEALGVRTYDQARASSNFPVLARAAATAGLNLSNFAGNLTYDDSCRRTLVGIGGRAFAYWTGLANAVSPDPFKLQPMGTATWDSAIGLWQSQLTQLLTEATATCGY